MITQRVIAAFNQLYSGQFRDPDLIDTIQRALTIAAAVIAMAHKLKLKIVAEGVEKEAPWTFLKKNHCDIAQGYLMGKPMNAADFVKTCIK